MNFVVAATQVALFWLVTCVEKVRLDPRGSREWVAPTKGGVWPKPQNINTKDGFFVVQPNLLQFSLTGKSGECKILQKAFTRHTNALRNLQTIRTNGKPYKPVADGMVWFKEPGFLGFIPTLTVQLDGDCDDSAYPSHDMVENYALTLSRDSKVLQSESVWGVLRGLETFTQLGYIRGESTTLFMNETTIEDSPRFKHRGLLLDTSRHFIPVQQIYKAIEGMSMNKLNLFHWHIVDAQSFPYQSKTYPELSEKGAWHPVYSVYSQKDVANIIEFARLRGVRVLPEFDTPGHTASWGDSHPELLTPCVEDGDLTGFYGPMHVIDGAVYEFMGKLLREIAEVFPEEYLHIGGDEVDHSCWSNHDGMNVWLEERGWGARYEKLEDYYIKTIVDNVHNLTKSAIVWEEVFTRGVEIPNSTIVQVWISDKGDPFQTLTDVVKAGKTAVFSACWYLNLDTSWLDWTKFYQCEPTKINATDEEKRRIIGGEAALWAEFVDENNIEQKLWPRACPAAERLWSNFGPEELEYEDFLEPAARLEEHVCRMNKRGVRAQPASGPNNCL